MIVRLSVPLGRHHVAADDDGHALARRGRSERAAQSSADGLQGARDRAGGRVRARMDCARSRGTGRVTGTIPWAMSAVSGWTTTSRILRRARSPGSTAQRVGVHALIRPRMIRTLQTRAVGGRSAASRIAMRVQLLRIDELNEEATLTRAELMAMQGAKVDALKLLDAYLRRSGVLDRGRMPRCPRSCCGAGLRRSCPRSPTITARSITGRWWGATRESKRLFAALVRCARGSRWSRAAAGRRRHGQVATAV